MIKISQNERGKNHVFNEWKKSLNDFWKSKNRVFLKKNFFFKNFQNLRVKKKKSSLTNLIGFRKVARQKMAFCKSGWKTEKWPKKYENGKKWDVFFIFRYINRRGWSRKNKTMKRKMTPSERTEKKVEHKGHFLAFFGHFFQFFIWPHASQGVCQLVCKKSWKKVKNTWFLVKKMNSTGQGCLFARKWPFFRNFFFLKKIIFFKKFVKIGEIREQKFSLDLIGLFNIFQRPFPPVAGDPRKGRNEAWKKLKIYFRPRKKG